MTNIIHEGKDWVRKGVKFFLSCVFRLFPVKCNKIVMDNFLGKGFGENPKYVAEELLRRGGYDIVWLCIDPGGSFPKGIRAVRRYSLRAFYEIATAKAWVFNTRNGKLTKKRKDQLLLQTWHGSVAMKKVEKDAAAGLSRRYIADAQEDGRVADGILVDGQANEALFKSSFWLAPGCELLRFGTPRTDVLLNERDNSSIKSQVRASLGIEQDSYLVLYAPTFREAENADSYLYEFDSVRHAFQNKHGKCAIAVRLHPNLQNSSFASAWLQSSGTVNASLYPDVDELVIASDCLITDYSSIAFDFAIIEKPVFLYAADSEKYIEKRGVYSLFYELPFRLNKNMDMLLEEITEYNREDYIARIRRFYEKYPTFNHGDASAKTVDWLISKGLQPKTA